MSYILKVVRPVNLQNYIATNAAPSLRAIPRDSWKAYLVGLGATGSTISQLEFSYLAAQPGQRLQEKWSAFLSGQAGNGTPEKARNLYK